MTTIFITGGTGYIGRRLIKRLLQQGGFRILALVRPGSERKLPAGCEPVRGNALDSSTYINNIPPYSIFIHLVGVAHPSPAKKEQFKTIDLSSVREAAIAANRNRVAHFIYMSVAQANGPLMRHYRSARAEGENLLRSSGVPSSFIRPWYVLGPGHWWPVLLLPLYSLASLFPSTRKTAQLLGLVTIRQMLETLVFVICSPAPTTPAIYTVPDIKHLGGSRSKLQAAL
jgi:uncharacterized protein YbjT (DUF2867 family)